MLLRFLEAICNTKEPKKLVRPHVIQIEKQKNKTGGLADHGPLSAPSQNKHYRLATWVGRLADIAENSASA